MITGYQRVPLRFRTTAIVFNGATQKKSGRVFPSIIKFKMIKIHFAYEIRLGREVTFIAGFQKVLLVILQRSLVQYAEGPQVIARLPLQVTPLKTKVPVASLNPYFMTLLPIVCLTTIAQ